MADCRVHVRLESSDRFSDDVARAHDAATRLNVLLVLRAATWEPHDWSDWEA